MATPDWEAIETAYRAGMMSSVKLQRNTALAKALSVSAPSVTTGLATWPQR
jgi:hypothetical protein